MINHWLSLVFQQRITDHRCFPTTNHWSPLFVPPVDFFVLCFKVYSYQNLRVISELFNPWPFHLSPTPHYYGFILSAFFAEMPALCKYIRWSFVSYNQLFSVLRKSFFTRHFVCDTFYWSWWFNDILSMHYLLSPEKSWQHCVWCARSTHW